MDFESEAKSEAFDAARFAIRVAVEAPRSAAIDRTALHSIASHDRPLFFEAALAVLDELPDGRPRVSAYTRLCELPEFLLELIRPDRYSQSRLIDLCSGFIQYDRRLDLHLAQLLPRRQEDNYHLAPHLIVRILDVLNEISVGSRLVFPLSHLTEHPDPAVAERAVVLMGRRIRNAAWPQRRLSSTEESVRAGAVEALWGQNSAAARSALWNCVNDASHRVMGKAIFGLHLLGEAAVAELVTGMIHDTRPPFRSTAARVLGKIGKEEYASLLAEALNDEDPRVRLEAKRALAAIRRAIQREQAAAASVEPQPVPTPEPALPEEPESEIDLSLHLDGRHTSLG